MSTHLEISLLGPIRISIDGAQLSTLRSRKSLWLVAYLVLADGKPVPRERIAHAFWPDSDTGTALSNLRAVVSDLRKALGAQKGRLRADDSNALLFDASDLSVDALEFDRAFREEDFERAIELYRGELVEGCRDDWAVQERNLRLEQVIKSYFLLAEKAVESGRLDAAVHAYRKAVELDPLSEEGIIGLMTALAEGGDLVEATHVYRAFTDRLRREIGIAPSDRLADIYLELRHGTWKRKPSTTAERERTGNIPFPLTTLVGREDELAAASSMLRQHRFVTLTGVGGVGKTRLAIQLARDLGSEFPDGVFFLSLESLTNEAQVLRSVAKTLDSQQEPSTLLQAAIAKTLRSKKTLLVLDNCEHLIAHCVLLATDLLSKCSDLKVLLTSRHGLAAQGERIFTVPGLSVPVPEHLPPGGSTRIRVSQSYESVALFEARAQSANPDFVVTADNAFLVCQICAGLEGIPLAIELAAAQVSTLALETIAEQLSGLVSLMVEPQVVAQPRHQTMRATLDWSYELLNREERELLERFSEFVGGWTLDAAIAVSSPGASTKRTTALIQSLVSKSLVVFEVSRSRYRLLEPVRLYANGSASESLKNDAGRRHQRWYVELSEEAEVGLVSDQLPQWMSRISQEHGNFLKAATGDAEQEIIGSLWRYWFIHGEYEFGYRLLEGAVIRASAGSPAILKCLLGAGILARGAKRFGDAKALSSEGLELATSHGDLSHRAAFLHELGIIAKNDGDSGYEDLYKESLLIRLEIGDFRGAASTTCSLANNAQGRGEVDLAKELFQRGFALAERAADMHVKAVLHLNSGVSDEMTGNFGAAREHYEKCLQFHELIGSKHGIAVALSGLGTLRQKQSENEGARWMYEKALQIFRDQGALLKQAETLQLLAENYISEGDLTLARKQNEEGLGILRSLGVSKQYVDALRTRAEISLAKGEAEAARVAVRECVDSLRSLGEDEILAQFLSDFASILPEE